MTISKRTLFRGLALTAVVVMLFAVAGIALAGNHAAETICVDGYIINHRELAVDGTELSPTLRVEAVNSAGQSVFADVDSAGYFEFEELPVGSWNFRLQLPESWDGIVPVAARGGVAETGITEFDEQTGCYRIVFKIRRLFDLTVLKWEELLDGTVQPGVDWEITATPVKDPFVKSQTETTNEGGRAQFTLTPGQWIISEKVEPKWHPVTPSKVTITLDQYEAAGAINPVVFKNREPACTSEIVVEKLGFGTDAEGTEIQLGPLAGWKVTVVRADHTWPPITKVTDGSGRATFSGLKPGVYIVSEHLQVGWESMDEDTSQTVIHRNCESSEVLFRNKEVTGELKIQGYKLFKAWEPPYKGHPVGLSGWVITATLVGTDIMTTTVTDALGHYIFPEAALEAAGMGFPGATVEVCEEQRDNWIHITPKCVRVKFPYPVPPNYGGAWIDFTNVQDPPVAMASTATTSVSGGCRTRYTVQRGDTMARIAAANGSSISAITRASGIANANLIRTGQVLCIP